MFVQLFRAWAVLWSCLWRRFLISRLAEISSFCVGQSAYRSVGLIGRRILALLTGRWRYNFLSLYQLVLFKLPCTDYNCPAKTFFKTPLLLSRIMCYGHISKSFLGPLLLFFLRSDLNKDQRCPMASCNYIEMDPNWLDALWSPELRCESG